MWTGGLTIFADVVNEWPRSPCSQSPLAAFTIQRAAAHQGKAEDRTTGYRLKVSVFRELWPLARTQCVNVAKQNLLRGRVK